MTSCVVTIVNNSCLIDTNVLIDFLARYPDAGFNERVLAVLAGYGYAKNND